jgi:hypothetical protein
MNTSYEPKLTRQKIARAPHKWPSKQQFAEIPISRTTPARDLRICFGWLRLFHKIVLDGRPTRRISLGLD